jgi:hypothetical protein
MALACQELLIVRTEQIFQILRMNGYKIGLTDVPRSGQQILMDLTRALLDHFRGRPKGKSCIGQRIRG